MLFNYRMPRIILILLFFPFVFKAQHGLKKRVLFLGNSYTYVNDLPAITASIAASLGDTLVYDFNTPGGYTFNNHYNDNTSKAKIAIGIWQYVVLQGQSQEPSFSPAQVASQSLPYVLKLDSLVGAANPCATTVLYETWGRKNGDQGNCAFYPPVCTYTGMQNRLRQSYKLFADTVKGLMAPVGEAFRASISFSPTLELYQPDESHPSLAGTYLAAAVFYESLFHRSVIGSTLNPGLPSATVAFLQQRAHAALRDSLDTWNFGVYEPWSDFEMVSSNNPTFQFYTYSPLLNNKWYFGEGSTSTLLNPSFTYTASGNFTVSHVVSTNCSRDSSIRVLQAQATTALNEKNKVPQFRVSPNPAMQALHVKFSSESAGTLLIRDISGRILMETVPSEILDVSSLAEGVYVIEWRTSQGIQTNRFIKTK